MDLLSPLLEDLYATIERPQRWRRFLRRSMAMFDSPRATLIVSRANSPGDGIYLFPGFEPELRQQYNERRHTEDYWGIPSQMPHKAGRPWLGTEFIGLKAMRRKDFYNDLGRTFDVEYCLGGSPYARDDDLVQLSFLRGRSDGNFSEDQKALATALFPHVKYAALLHWKLCEAQSLQRRLGAGFAAIGYGVLLVDRSGRVLVRNSEADRLLTASDGIGLLAGRIMLADREAQARLERCLAAAVEPAGISAQAPGGIIAARRESGLPYEILVCPAVRDPLDDRNAWRQAALVLIRDRTVRPRVDLESLETLYGLTDAEARLTAEVFQGGTLAEVADRLEIGMNTAKTELKAVFRKLGVSSKPELVRLLALGFAAR